MEAYDVKVSRLPSARSQVRACDWKEPWTPVDLVQPSFQCLPAALWMKPNRLWQVNCFVGVLRLDSCYP